MTPLRIGLLAASKIAVGAVMAPAKERDDVAITAVAARDPARARAYAETHGIPAAAESYDALIARDDVDVVYVGNPIAGHAEWTIKAVQAGKAVLCEKAFALNAEEGRAMVAAAEAAGRPLLEAFHYRFHNVMRRAEAIVASGELGRLGPRRRDVRCAHPLRSGRDPLARRPGRRRPRGPRQLSLARAANTGRRAGSHVREDRDAVRRRRRHLGRAALPRAASPAACAVR